MKLLFLAGNILAGFLDFAIGIFVVAMLSSVWGIELSPWVLVVGGIAAVLPDFDVIWFLVSKGKPSGDHHQSIFHRPLVMIPVVGLLALIAGGDFWCAAISVCLFWHYLHDTRGFGGGGIAWFWPFSRKYWSLTGGQEPESSIMATSESGHVEWINTVWLRPSRICVRHTVTGSLLLGIALSLVTNAQTGIIAFTVVLLSISSLWMLNNFLKKPVSK